MKRVLLLLGLSLSFGGLLFGIDDLRQLDLTGYIHGYFDLSVTKIHADGGYAFTIGDRQLHQGDGVQVGWWSLKSPQSVNVTVTHTPLVSQSDANSSYDYKLRVQSDASTVQEEAADGSVRFSLEKPAEGSLIVSNYKIYCWMDDVADTSGSVVLDTHIPGLYDSTVTMTAEVQ